MIYNVMYRQTMDTRKMCPDNGQSENWPNTYSSQTIHVSVHFDEADTLLQ